MASYVQQYARTFTGAAACSIASAIIGSKVVLAAQTARSALKVGKFFFRGNLQELTEYLTQSVENQALSLGQAGRFLQTLSQEDVGKALLVTVVPVVTKGAKVATILVTVYAISRLVTQPKAEQPSADEEEEHKVFMKDVSDRPRGRSWWWR